MIHMRTGASPLWGAGAAAPHLGGAAHEPPRTECGTQSNRPPSRPPRPVGVRGGGGQNRRLGGTHVNQVGVPSAIQRHREERAVSGEGYARKPHTV